MNDTLPPALDAELSALLGADDWLTGEPLRRDRTSPGWHSRF